MFVIIQIHLKPCHVAIGLRCDDDQFVRPQFTTDISDESDESIDISDDDDDNDNNDVGKSKSKTATRRIVGNKVNDHIDEYRWCQWV